MGFATYPTRSNHLLRILREIRFSIHVRPGLQVLATKTFDEVHSVVSYQHDSHERLHLMNNRSWMVKLDFYFSLNLDDPQAWSVNFFPMTKVPFKWDEQMVTKN